jgi:hypothetical protein
VALPTSRQATRKLQERAFTRRKQPRHTCLSVLYPDVLTVLQVEQQNQINSSSSSER